MIKREAFIEKGCVVGVMDSSSERETGDMSSNSSQVITFTYAEKVKV